MDMNPALSRFRLRQHPDFFRFARRIHSASFTMLVKPFSRWEVTATAAKSVAKKAVDRNKLKRRFRAAAQALTSQGYAQPAQLVIQAKRNAATQTFKDLTQELLTSWQKLNRSGS